MSRRKYYVRYWNNFSNTYELYYTDNGEAVRDDFEQITRKEAIALCVEEKRRRKYDQAFSGAAATTIVPYGYRDDGNIWNDKMYYLDGYIWEKRKHSINSEYDLTMM